MVTSIVGLCLLLAVCPVAWTDHGGHAYGNHGGGGGGHRGHGYGGWNNYQNNPSNHANPGYGYYDRLNYQQEQGCTRPQFTGSAQFEVEGCKVNAVLDYCLNKSSRVPFGKSGIMSCVRGRRLLRLTSRCEEDGCWKPDLVSNCDQLFELLAEVKGTTKTTNPPEPEYQKPLPRHCSQVNVNQFRNFVITCHSPQGQREQDPNDADCMSQYKNGVPSGTRISIKCRPPSTSYQTEPNDLTCQDGHWEGKLQKIVCNVPSQRVETEKPKNPVTVPNKTPAGPTSCAPLKVRSGIELTCTWAGPQVEKTDCGTRMPVGAEARYACANYYESTTALPTLYRKCKEDGTWSGTSDFNCVVACGRDNAVKVAFITHSLPTFQGQWPWHAALFRNRSSDPDSWEYICGGTLITKKALVTAGHCVTLLQTSKVVSTTDIQVHLGKYRREVTDEHVQIKQIQEIIVNPNYNPYNYDSDVAIIIFKTEVTIGEIMLFAGHFVRPICFLTTSDSALEDLQLSDDSVGTVVGWGYDENNKLADDLRMAHLRVVGTRECAKSMMGSSITQLNTRSTTYCAGYANGTNVCNGDSGSGMYFPTVDTDNTRWYLEGLVSVGIAHSNGRCNPEAFSVFTRLGRYADFMTRTLSEQDAL